MRKKIFWKVSKVSIDNTTLYFTRSFWVKIIFLMEIFVLLQFKFIETCIKSKHAIFIL